MGAISPRLGQMAPITGTPSPKVQACHPAGKSAPCKKSTPTPLFSSPCNTCVGNTSCSKPKVVGTWQSWHGVLEGCSQKSRTGPNSFTSRNRHVCQLPLNPQVRQHLGVWGWGVPRKSPSLSTISKARRGCQAQESKCMGRAGCFCFQVAHKIMEWGLKETLSGIEPFFTGQRKTRAREAQHTVRWDKWSYFQSFCGGGVCCGINSFKFLF